MASNRDRSYGRWRSLALLLLALAVVGAAPPQLVSAPDAASVRNEDDPYRLDRSVLPYQYNLRLEPNLDAGTFHGEVEILVTAKAAVKKITLHSSGIEFETVKVTHIDDETSQNNFYESEEFRQVEFELVDIHLKDDLVPEENYVISITYGGTLRDNMYGFYLSTYNYNGPKKLAATQFQATHARKAFPCFDEPSFKAKFQVTILAPTDYEVLSNMPINELNDLFSGDDLVEHVFHNSVTMPSYLVAFVVSQFVPSNDEGNDGDGEVIFKTWTRPDVTERADYSLKVSRSMLKVLEGYTNIPYTDPAQVPSLNKVDQVALPDFAAGAMENWGLITYRETALLFNGGSADAQKRVATVIAHELLHMWFGNLITTYWWDTTWLNEGFARYFQYFITDKVETTWRMWDQFVVDQHQSVFVLDSRSTAKALTHDVSTPAEVSASFGSITYNKGGSVLRMISYTVGPVNFQVALQNYLNEHAYDSVKPQDLFDELNKFAANANLEEDEFQEFLLSWTTVPGYPIVHVVRDYESNTAAISQKRFLFNEVGDEKYYVPLTWTEDGGSFDTHEPTHYLYKDSITDLAMPSAEKWVLFNVQETGYYRVNYDDTNWKLISTHLNDRAKSIESIHVLNRAQLVDDAFNLARAGELKYETTFAVADYLARETDYVPWAAAFSAFSYLDRMLVNHPKYPVFQRYVLRLIDRAYGKFEETFSSNNAPDRHVEKLLMNRLGSWACSLNHEKCQTHAISRLRAYLDDNNSRVNADQRSVVYCHGIRNSPEDWGRLWTLYQESDDDVERGLIIGGLACSSEESHLKQLLLFSIADEDIRKQDASSVFTAVYGNPLGVNVALEFLDENFQQVYNYYGSMGSINSIVTGIAERLTTLEQRKQLDDFVTKYSDELGASAAAALATVDDNLEWLSSHEVRLFEVLEDNELQQYRLQEWMTPNHYTISLEPHLESKVFDGNVVIEITAHISTETIILHAEGIIASKISVKSAVEEDGEELLMSSRLDTTLEFLVIQLTDELTSGENYKIDITFSGTLRDNMYGFYYSTYFDEDLKEIPLAATQFQPTHARKAFPCFDEPGFKATFTVTITAPEGYEALGNMPAETIRRRDGSKDITFKRTPLMSTYLLAFVISDFVHEEDARGAEEVVFRTWARQNAIEWANYSMQVSRPILETLEDFTGIDYIDREADAHFDKVDQVALPDFSAGAMENWGLITYRETALLYNDGSASARRSVATIIAHELAHMWFGNLVTTHWWDTTWLNEGFAQYLQFYATSKVKTDWRLMDQFLVDHHQGVFTSDSLATSVALTSPAFTPSQVMARFSTITYSKGASILRMLSAIMGQSTFEEALHTYLDKHRYSSTKPADLFEELIKKSYDTNLNQDSFEKLLYSWTDQPGFPVVSINRTYDERTADVSQKRFLLKTPESAEENQKLYYVPLTWVEQGGDFSIGRPQLYLSDEQLTITEMPDEHQWVIFNVRETGFYRVNYDDTNWKLLSDYLNNPDNPLNGIHELNRAQLLDDAFNLARAGQLPYATVFQLTDYLPRETDYIPWASAFAAFSYLQRMLVYNERYENFESYVLHLVEDHYHFFNFEDQNSHIENMFLNRVSTWACSVQHAPCTSAAKNALEKFIDEDETVPADLRSVVYCYGISHSTDEYWQDLFDKYKFSLDNAERALIMAGLACSREEERLRELLNESITGKFIRKQDASSVFSAVYSNFRGVEVALDFLDENFDEVQEYYGSMGAIDNIVVGIASRLTTSQQREKMQIFVDKHSSQLGATGGDALETIDENINWLTSYGEIILDLIQEDETTTTETTPETTAENSSETEETQEPSESEETPEPSESEETPEPSESEETAEPSESDETTEPSESEETPEPSESEETPEPSESEETPEPSESEETPEPSESEETPDPSESEETPDPSESTSTEPTTTEGTSSLRGTVLAVLLLLVAVWLF